MLNNMRSISLIFQISKSTRIVGSSAILLDNIFISKPWEYIASIFVTDITDHFPVFIILKQFWNSEVKDKKYEVKYRVSNNVINN